MALINESYLNLQGSYLFSDIAKRINSFKDEKPDANILRLGIGDVTQPLVPAVINNLHTAVNEMAMARTFRGYGPEQGYDFLRSAILESDYTSRSIKLDIEEVFISDGAKSDVSNIQEIFGVNNIVAITDPVYPVYLDSNIIAGRTGSYNDGRYEGLVYMPCNAENSFIPALPTTKVDLIYLCAPNNPTGTTLSRAELKKWIDYAKANKSIILFDSAYEAYIQEQDIPHSIYEIEGAKDVAIEFRSFSKTAGFTGTRCAYTIVPKTVIAYTASGETYEVNNLWNRRQTTKFNGVPYIIQRGAEAIYSTEGQQQVKLVINYYMTNSAIILEGIKSVGLQAFGGINAPYIWLKTPNNMDSWAFFDKLLNEAHIVGTPGTGFGPSGAGYFRLTAFASRENTEQAIHRIKTRLQL
jgi:LL-diaminopimelate aminotransferase